MHLHGAPGASVAIVVIVVAGAAGVAYATNAVTRTATTTIQACEKGNGRSSGSVVQAPS